MPDVGFLCKADIGRTLPSQPEHGVIDVKEEFATVPSRQRLVDLMLVLAWVGSLAAIIVGVVWYFSVFLTKAEIQQVSRIASNLILLSVIVGFISWALYKRVNVYDAFVEGAKGGIQVSLTIIPFLVGMLVAISVLRNSGVLDMVVGGFAWGFAALGFNTDFVPVLPTAFMKSISGSGSRAMMIELMKTYGPDSFVGRLASIVGGSSDTTFYIIALYFGSVGITRTRYAITYGLLADFAAVAAAIGVAYLFFH